MYRLHVGSWWPSKTMWFSASFWLLFLQKRSQESVRASRNEEKEPGHIVCSGCWQQWLELTSTPYHAARLPPKSKVSRSAACLGHSHHRRNHLSIALQPGPLPGAKTGAVQLLAICWYKPRMAEAVSLPSGAPWAPLHRLLMDSV